MDHDENKRKHLDFIQLTITRMAANSFLLKAWGVTLVAGIFALNTAQANYTFLYIAYVPMIAFWILDGYYLQQEKKFRSLYDDVRLREPSEIDFSLKTNSTQGWLASMFSRTELIFYGVLVLSLTLVVLIVR